MTPCEPATEACEAQHYHCAHLRRLLTDRRDLWSYLDDGDHNVPRTDEYGTPRFIEGLWDDVAEIPDWPLSADGIEQAELQRINPVVDVPFGTYAWRVRRLQRTVDSVIR